MGRYGWRRSDWRCTALRCAPPTDQPDAPATYTFGMRLSEHQRDVIRRATAELAGPSARVLLFGSRTRPELRGGDIDLLVELVQPNPDRFALGMKLGARIERQLGLQKIDILIADPATPDSPVLAAARHDAVPV